MAPFMIPIRMFKLFLLLLSYDTRPISQHALSILFTTMESTSTANEAYSEFTFDVQCQVIRDKKASIHFDRSFVSLSPEAWSMGEIGQKW